MPSLGLGAALPFGLGVPAQQATPFDPSTLTFNASVYKQWWHRSEANFRNGGSAAANGDPVSLIRTQSGTGGFNVDNTYAGGPSGVLRADGLELVNAGGGNLTTFQDGGFSFAARSAGMTIGFRVKGAAPSLIVAGSDFSPIRFGTGLSVSGGHIQYIAAGNSSQYEFIGHASGAADAQQDGEFHDYFAFWRTNDPTGAASQVAIYQDGTLLGSGPLVEVFNCTFFGIYGGDCTLGSFFMAAQNFEADIANLRNFARYGSGV